MSSSRLDLQYIATVYSVQFYLCKSRIVLHCIPIYFVYALKDDNKSILKYIYVCLLKKIKRDS